MRKKEKKKGSRAKNSTNKGLIPILFFRSSSGFGVWVGCDGGRTTDLPCLPLRLAETAFLIYEKERRRERGRNTEKLREVSKREMQEREREKKI